MKTLQVELGARSYPIHTGAGLLGHAELLRSHLPGHQVMVVSNETVAPLYLQRVMSGLAGLDARTLVLPDGEEHKTVAQWSRVLDALLEARFARDCTVLALGGGVIGDLAGFAAACYQRGVCLVQVPTTLLAQVDSSVGGKTAVNHRLGKNMIGAFHQPACVLADTDTLATLPARELAAGLAEVVKYGLIRDPGFFTWLEDNMEALVARDEAALAHAIHRSCANKAEVVAADERESGTRALLNFGHTFGHAIEAGLGYGAWLHGEAVAAGMCLAAELSCRRATLSAADAARVPALLRRAGLPVEPPAGLPAERFIELMGMDKKVKGGRMRFVVLDAIGRAGVADGIAVPLLCDLLAGAGHAA